MSGDGSASPRGLDHDMIETRNLAVLAGMKEIVECGDEVAEHGAAQAPFSSTMIVSSLRAASR